MNMKKIRILLLMLILSLVLLMVGCKKEVEKEVGKEVSETGSEEKEVVGEEKIKEEETQGGKDMNLEQLKQPEIGEEVAVITTNYGEIKIRLFPEVAPKAVENFKTHAKEGYYNGVTFHRIINEFMLQTGDPNGTGTGGKSIWGSAFEDEFNKDYHNYRGTLSMANAGPGTNGSQFFIVQKTSVEEDMMAQLRQSGEANGFSEEVIKAYEELGGTPWLDFKHTVFGQVYEGMDIVDKIASVKVGAGDKPIEPVIMEKVEIIKYK